MTLVGMGIGQPSSGLRFATTRGRIQGGSGMGVNYPSPFFDVANTYLPTTVKQMFRWCRYYFMTNPLINATVFKLSEYPVTDIIIDHANESTKKIWEEYIQDHLRYRAFQVEVGLDYHTYGNALVGLSFPFQKFLTCRSCRFQEQAKKIRDRWTFTNFNFRLTCPKCGVVAEAEVKDFYIKDASGIKLVRWNPEDVEITYNDFTGQYTHYYTIPGPLRSDIVIGKKDVVEQVPQIFIQALRQQKGVVFSKDMLFHMRRPTLANQDRGWGSPLILPVLKDAFYMQVMKKAQEAILLEHIVPLRVLFPQAGSGSSDPYCVAPDTLVETVDGLRPAEEVGAGDYLRSHTGAWREVQATKRRAVGCTEKVYRVGVASLSAFPFDVSEDHPILAVKKTGRRGRQQWVDPAFVPVSALSVGDYVAYPCIRTVSSAARVDLGEYLESRSCTDEFVYRRLNQGSAEAYEWLEQSGDPTFARGDRAAFLKERGWVDADYENAKATRAAGSVDRVERWLPLNSAVATLIGYYLAEGSLKTGGTPSFSLGLDEHWIADEIEAAVSSLGFRHTTRHERAEQGGLTVDVQDVLLGEFLHAVCGQGFAGKRIPQFMSEAPAQVVTRMLRCLFAGDGCSFSTGTNRAALKMSNPSVVLEVRRLLLSFGLLGCLSREVMDENDIAKADAFHLNFNGEQADALRRLFNEKLLCETPYSRCGVFRGDYVLMRIDALDEVSGVPEVIGFQMAEDKSFCVAGVATHNTTINLDQWRDHVAQEIARWRYDNNYIPIMPLPIGQETIGGDGKALLLTQEMQMWSEQILNGMQVPREFIMGGLSYAGTNVSMRMMENMFLGYILYQKHLLHFVMQNIAAYLDWPLARARFKPFKMADDLQRLSLVFQANQAQKISDSTFLSQIDLSQEEENKIMLKETASRLESTQAQQLAMADVQGKSQMIMMKYQAKAQAAGQQGAQQPQAPGEPGGPDALMQGTPGGQQQGASGEEAPMGVQQQAAAAAPGEGASSVPQQAQSPLNAGQNMQQQGPQMDMQSWAMAQAQQLAQLPKDQQEAALQNLQQQNPELADLVRQLLSQMGGSEQQPTTDMRPLPDKLPPRRAAQII